jgi:hypothetical protein
MFLSRYHDAQMAGYDDMMASGSQLPFVNLEGKFTVTGGISAVFAEQLNVFQGQVHYNTDDLVHRYWDDGHKVVPQIGWEGHDGDTHPNAATSSLSLFGEYTWMSVEGVAKLLNISVDEFTPERFKQVYVDAWIKGHEEEASLDNPNTEAEMEIIEQTKNETNPTDDVAAPVQPDSTEENGGTDSTVPIEDDSGGERKLVSVAARIVSAALHVFGV